jgi:hypothetical protein
MSAAIGSRRAATDPLIIAVLAAGGSQEDAAARVGVSARTIRRRLREPEFVAELERIQAQTIHGIAESLRLAAPAAVERLRALLDERDVPASVQVSAARTLRHRRRRSKVARGGLVVVPHQFKARLDRLEREFACLQEDRRVHLASMREEFHTLHDRRPETTDLDKLDSLRDRPSCHRPLRPRLCDSCQAWQEYAHAFFLGNGFNDDGTCNFFGVLFEIRSEQERWPLAARTRRLLKEIKLKRRDKMPPVLCLRRSRGKRITRLRGRVG